MALFFDTETSSLYDKKAPPSASHQPHLVQFAAILDDEEGNIKAEINCRVKSGLETEVPEGARNVHGIDKAEIDTYGIPVKIVCATFSHLRKMTPRLVAHNIEFDMGVMAVQFARINHDFDVSTGVFCTMMASSYVLKIPNEFGNSYKWPNLKEAYETLVDEEGFEGAHDAMADVRACREVYYKLKELKYAT